MGIIEKMRLDGKKGFVTGAARGIGKCTATAFAEAGADVAIVDLDLEEAKKTAKEIAEKTGRRVIAVKTDCTDPKQVDAMVEEVVKELGGLDFCHNNAGICINYILAVAFRDSAYRTFASTGSAANTRIINYICHNKFLLNGNRFESIL